MYCVKAGVCCGPCNPSKWEADIWGWLKVRRSAMLHYTVNQRPHWACWQYGRSGGTQEWLVIERCQLCLQDTSHNAKWHRRAAVGHWVLLCVKCCRMVDSVPRWRLSLSWPIQSDYLSIANRMILPLGREHSHGKTQFIPGKQVLVRSWLRKIYYYMHCLWGKSREKINTYWVCEDSNFLKVRCASGTFSTILHKGFPRVAFITSREKHFKGAIFFV